MMVLCRASQTPSVQSVPLIVRVFRRSYWLGSRGSIFLLNTLSVLSGVPYARKTAEYYNNRISETGVFRNMISEMDRVPNIPLRTCEAHKHWPTSTSFISGHRGWPTIPLTRVLMPANLVDALLQGITRNTTLAELWLGGNRFGSNGRTVLELNAPPQLSVYF